MPDGDRVAGARIMRVLPSSFVKVSMFLIKLYRWLRCGWYAHGDLRTTFSDVRTDIS